MRYFSLVQLLGLVVFVAYTPMLYSQSYSHWITGDTSDFVTTDHLPGVVLAGGGGDNDNAMRWMLQRAAGGDVVVLRASGSDGYNPYFFAELGVVVHSVETIRFDGAAAAYDPYILRRIREAEVLFFAGGDQYVYYDYWKDTPVEAAIDDLIHTKRITVGGTSAGMAILGGAYYVPPNGSATSDQLLANPFHPNADILGWNDFLTPPYLDNVITDTHYDQRDRNGRHLVFLARLFTTTADRVYGIACNEYTAVVIEPDGTARVYGAYPTYDDVAYFLQTNCQDNPMPEHIATGQPLTWNRDESAVIAYAVGGTPTGSVGFDLRTWSAGNGGEWQHWWAESGELSRAVAPDGNCNAIPLSIIDDSASSEPTPPARSVAAVWSLPAGAGLG